MWWACFVEIPMAVMALGSFSMELAGWFGTTRRAIGRISMSMCEIQRLQIEAPHETPEPIIVRLLGEGVGLIAETRYCTRDQPASRSNDSCSII